MTEKVFVPRVFIPISIDFCDLTWYTFGGKTDFGRLAHYTDWLNNTCGDDAWRWEMNFSNDSVIGIFLDADDAIAFRLKFGL